MLGRKPRKNRKRAQRRQRRLRVESLENRRLLAGDVTVGYSGDSLIITGDFDDNNISIEGTADGVVKITGNGTTINGVNSPFEFPLDQDLRISMGDGNDTVDIDGNFFALPGPERSISRPSLSRTIVG